MKNSEESMKSRHRRKYTIKNPTQFFRFIKCVQLDAKRRENLWGTDSAIEDSLLEREIDYKGFLKMMRSSKTGALPSYELPTHMRGLYKRLDETYNSNAWDFNRIKGYVEGIIEYKEKRKA